MSLHLNFEPHSWYMGFAIRDCRNELIEATGETAGVWNAITANGDTYRVVDLEAPTLRELKQQIKEWHKAEAERDAYNRARLEQKQ